MSMAVLFQALLDTLKPPKRAPVSADRITKANTLSIHLDSPGLPATAEEAKTKPERNRKGGELVTCTVVSFMAAAGIV
jgi:hypothetical protein